MHHHNHHHHHQSPPVFARSLPIPQDRLPFLFENTDPTIVKRSHADPILVARATKTCGPKDTTGKCTRPQSATNTTTLPIVLGVVIPLTAALIVFFFLHRRHVKKLRKEDANDKHKSLDFGMDYVPPTKTKDRALTPGSDAGFHGDSEKAAHRRGPGLSMDWAMDSSPYFLPPAIHGSQESLHSLSRSFHGDGDKYRPATNFTPGDNGSMRSGRTGRKNTGGMDDASSFTGSTSKYAHGDEMQHGLLHNAQRMSKSPPLWSSNQQSRSPTPPAAVHLSPSGDRDELGLPSFSQSSNDKLRVSDSGRDLALRGSHNYLRAFIQSGDKPDQDNIPRQQSPPLSKDLPNDPPVSYGVASSTPPAPPQAPPTSKYVEPTSTYELPSSKNEQPTSKYEQPTSTYEQPTSKYEERTSTYEQPTSTYEQPISKYEQPSSTPVTATTTTSLKPAEHSNQAQTPQISINFDDDRSDYGDRDSRNFTVPQVNVLPAEAEHKAPAPEAAEASVDDFYDSYYDGGYQFDTRRLTMGIRPLPPEDPSDNPEQRANRIRSFYKEYFDDSKPFQQDYYEDYGPEAHQLNYMPDPPPFAQPVGRRAMTPPPRMPPGMPPRRQPGAASAFGFAHGPGHHPSGSMSSGPGPRAFSSASGRIPNRGPKKPLPPPSPLHALPTPHMLKDDIILPIDFAPAANAGARRMGRAETPQGGLRPYMLAVPAHIPLASSYDDLAMVPSPHALRKSGTYTALDFAPPPRFKNADTASDSGSIRSNRTGISAAQAHSIRAGAYRVSRLPAETVGTRDDLNSNLRPTWDMRG
ncbi:hypothetical protein FQN57_000284 [Myotisia sp. PD_48]|nr:hypothetical protein FQN57_000284 [Myotisia sp. PD_48]